MKGKKREKEVDCLGGVSRISFSPEYNVIRGEQRREAAILCIGLRYNLQDGEEGGWGAKKGYHRSYNGDQDQEKKEGKGKDSTFYGLFD